MHADIYRHQRLFNMNMSRFALIAMGTVCFAIGIAVNSSGTDVGFGMITSDTSADTRHTSTSTPLKAEYWVSGPDSKTHE
jgi:hypothetical protein